MRIAPLLLWMTFASAQSVGQLPLPVEQITHLGGMNLTPDLAPDGERIAMGAVRGPSTGRSIRIVSTDGSGERQLTSSLRDQAPIWSPDGRSILFDSFRDGNAEIYVMDADGGNQRRLTANDVYDSGATWSADGEHVLWFSGEGAPAADDDYGASDLWIMRVDGTDKRKVAALPGSDTYPSWSPDGRRIVFTSHRHGNSELYLINTDGSGLRRLTHHPASDDHPRWSPDGLRIAFLSWRDGSEGLYLLTPETLEVEAVPTGRAASAPAWSRDGAWLLFHSRTEAGTELFRVRVASVRTPMVEFRDAAAGHPGATPGPRNVTNSGAQESQPSWSPDGRFIAFVSDRITGVDWGEQAIYLLDLGRGSIGRMRRSLDDARPSWSPDGSRLAFESNDRDERARIYVARTDGRSSQNLTPEPGDYSAPAWSPDAASIVYAGRPETATASDIYRLDLHGQRRTRLTDGGGQNTNPTWSPDGRWIAFTSTRDRNREIYLVASGGGPAIRLTNHPGEDDLARWSPDGRSLIFVSNRDGNSEIYVMCADGSGQTNVTGNPSFDGWPAWSPGGDQIAFTSTRDGTMDIFLMSAPVCPTG